MKKKTSKKPTMMVKYIMVLRSVGNPDFQQYAPVSNPEVVTGNTLKEMRAHAERYKEFWNLGGGNWTNPTVISTNGNKIVGHFSYNGRFWEGDGKFKSFKDMEKRREINIKTGALKEKTTV
jgi:hypothetical protein